jgi:GNAT superfamily N-acetyltransferase
MAAAVTFLPVTPDRWSDLDRLFSESAGEELGNPSRCWCMEWRLTDHDEWRNGAGEKNHEGMRQVVARGEVPGIIAYSDGIPAAWCSVSPRPTLIGMRREGEFRRFDDPTIWSIICFYVAEPHRGHGLMPALLEAAADYARESGASLVEGYPFVPELATDGAGGTVPVFERAGFTKVAEIRPGQFTMRRHFDR